MSRTLLALLSSLGISLAYAQLPPPGQPLPPVHVLPPSVTVSADAVIEAQPDRVQIDVGVVTESRNAREAAQQNAQRAQAMLDALKKSVGAAGTIRTLGYSIQPAYDYPREGGQPILRGYTARNVVRVVLTDINQSGAVVDAATRAGANQVDSIEHQLSEEHPARKRVLRDAATKARAEAQELAAALDTKIVRVLSASEQFATPPQPFYREATMARADGAATPIVAGTIPLTATVTLTVEIAPR